MDTNIENLDQQDIPLNEVTWASERHLAIKAGVGSLAAAAFLATEVIEVVSNSDPAVVAGNTLAAPFLLGATLYMGKRAAEHIFRARGLRKGRSSVKMIEHDHN